jgi:anti-sigma regulatory factor (Ser/Thr protein kinase)
MRWSFESADAGRAYSARDGLLAYLESHADGGSDIEAAALIFGELVGNVVRHAPGPIAIDLSWERGVAVLRVTDRGPGYRWNGAARLPDSTAESGRGLFIVYKVALRLRVSRVRGNGTVATAWLPVRLDRSFQARAF